MGTVSESATRSFTSDELRIAQLIAIVASEAKRRAASAEYRLPPSPMAARVFAEVEVFSGDEASAGRIIRYWSLYAAMPFPLGLLTSTFVLGRLSCVSCVIPAGM